MNKETETLAGTIRYFLTPFDKRYEDLIKGDVKLNIFRDIMAGLVVAMVAIPMAMGFAMASGLEPEQGIVGGAVAGLLGALFGGSKYQVYGPTAAYIPVIAGLMAVYNHSFLILVSLVAGVLLMLSGVFKLGKIIAMVPNSIIVGFTIGIALVIALSQLGGALGITENLGYGLVIQITKLLRYVGDINPYAVALAALTFVICKYLLKVSPFIPAPLLSLGVGLLISSTIWNENGLILISDMYGSIPTNFLLLTFPALPEITASVVFDLIYYASAIYIVAAIESLLCSRMADRLANNSGTPYNPNKELWGQGMVNIVTPMFNGFPHTGALARTAVNIKLGAVSPLAGIAKFFLKLTMAAYLAVYLEQVPMACIGGILLWVANGMIKKKEITAIMKSNRFHIFLMVYTAVMVPLFGFMEGTVSAILIYLALKKLFDPEKAIAGSMVFEEEQVKQKI